MINSSKIIPIKIFIYLISAILFAISLDYSMVDDGLRHVSFSYHQETMMSWGAVFPNSLFNDYDPWFMWHKLLSALFIFAEYDNIHILVNSISLFILMLMIDLLITQNTKYEFKSMIFIVVLAITYLSSYRYLMVRPDLLSGLYVMAALVFYNRTIVLFVLTIIYGPFYYLFFLYTGSIGLVFLIQKKIKSFVSVFIASSLSLGIHLCYDFENYIYTVKNILLDQKLRMGLEVGEGQALFEFLKVFDYFLLVGIFFLVNILIIYKKYDYFKKNSLALFLLITSILWVNQVRYYVLFLPLFSVYLFTLFLNINKKRFLFKIRKFMVLSKRYINFSKNKKLFYLIAIPYTIFILFISFETKSVNNQVFEGKFFEQEKFKDKIVLSNTLNVDMYKGLYFNPTVKFVPSCSIGWFENNKYMKDIYIKMMKDEGVSEFELKKLVKYVNADYYIHYTSNPKQVLDFNKLLNLGILPEKIYHNKIIFKIEK